MVNRANALDNFAWESIFCSLKRPVSNIKFRSVKIQKLATLKQFAFFYAF